MSEDDTPQMDAKIWRVRHDFYSSIGQAISHWSSMEDTLVRIAAQLLGTTNEKTGLLLYSIMNFFAWLAIIEELFILEPKFTDHKGEWGVFSDKLRALNNTRARLAHHSAFGYGAPIDAPPVLRPGPLDARTKSRKQPPLTNSEVVQFIQEVGSLDNELIVFLRAVMATSQKPSTSSLGTLFEQQGDPLNPTDATQSHSPKEPRRPPQS